MAKKTELVRTDEHEVALTASTPPAELEGMVGEDEGRGTSTRQEDNIVPLVYVLQGQSPQVMRGNPGYMEGAQPGMIWLRSYDDDPFIDGEKGMLFQSCWFDLDWVRWKPRNAGGGGGQGFVGRYRPEPGEEQAAFLRRLGVHEVPDPQDNTRKVLAFEDGGDWLVETRYHAGYVLGHAPTPLPYLIPLSSTGHAVSREWMFKMNSVFIGKTRAPSWAKAYRLRTKLRTRGTQSWYQLTVRDEGWLSQEDYLRGRALNLAFEGGEKRGAEPDSPAAGTEEDPPF